MLVAGIGILLYGYFHSKSASAAWFDENWAYRQTVAITNSGSNQTDYQVQITVNTSTLVTAGKMQSSCNDVRITDINGKLLPLWIEPTTCNTTTTKIWTKVPSITTSGATVYLYYGNPSATSISATTPTFIREITNVQGAWLMDETSWTQDCTTTSVTDSSTNSNNGKSCPSTTGPTTTSSGKFSYSGNFDGVNDYVSVPDHSSLKPTTAISIAMWVNPTAFNNAAGNSFPTIIDKGDGNDRLFFDTAGALTSRFTGFTDLTSVSTVSTGAWTHVVLTYGGSGFKMYFNGALNNSDSQTGSLTTSTDDLWIGDRLGNDRTFQGKIDEVRVYNKELSAAEISDIGNSNQYGYVTTNYANKELVRKRASTEPSAGTPATEEQAPGPVAYWKFDDGQGTTAQDSTVNNNDGSLGAVSSQVTLDRTTTGSGYGATSYNFDITVGSGHSNNLLVVGFSSVNSNVGVGMSYNGQAFLSTNKISVASTASGDKPISEIWWLPNPTADGSAHTLTIATTNTQDIDIGVTSWYNVDQTNPVGDSETTATSSPSSSASVTLNNYPPNSVVIDHFSPCHTGVCGGTTYTPGTGQTQLYSYAGAGNADAEGSYTIGAASTTMSYTLGASKSWAYGAISLNAAGTSWAPENQCISGKCLFFNGGSSNVSVSNAITGVKSVSMWVRPNAFTSTTPLMHLDASTHTLTTDSSGVLTANGFTSPTYYINGNKTTSPTLTANQWNHVMVTTDTSFDTTSALTIGKSSTNYLKGYIDEVKLFNFARSQAQVLQDYNAGKNNAGTKQGVSAVLGAQTEKWLSEGLVGYWKMDDSGADAEGEYSTDSSGNGNNGMLYGDNSTGDNGTGLDCTAAGKFGSGCSLDGTDDYILNSSLSGTSKNEETISVWVKPSSVTGNQDIVSIGHGASGSGNYTLVQLSGTSVKFRQYTSSYQDITATGVLSIGTWTHITVVHSVISSRAELYINGALAGTGSTYSDSSNNHSYMEVGRNSNTGTGEQYNGVVDSLRIYNRALSSKEVSDLYNWAPGPVGYWNLEEGTGTTANDTRGGNTGTITGAAWTNGKVGKALNFDGSNDIVEIANESNFDFTSNFTIETWIQPTGSDTYNGIVGKYVGAASGWDFILTNGLPRMAVRGTSSIDNSGVGSDLRDGKWHHVGVVVNGTSSITTYVDGQLINTTSGTWTATTNDGAVKIGGRNGASDLPFRGKIDDVRIYNYARSAKQVVSDMNAGHPAVGSPVGSALGYWKFDEGTDNTCSGGTNDACNSGSAGSTLDGAGTGFSSPATATSGWTQSGKFGRALNYDGSDDKVTVGTAINNIQTVSFWVNPTTNSDSFMDLDGGTHYITSSSGTITATGFTSPTIYVNGVSGGTITASAWNHVVVTTATSFNSSASFTMGYKSAATADYLTGSLDEVKIYNYALTADQVKLDYNQGASIVQGALGNNSTYQVQAANQEYCVPGDTTSCSAPIAEWKLEERKGTSANDTSGNNKTGTLGGDGSGTDLPTWTSGKIGSALNFDGSDDYVEGSNVFAISSTTAWSISLWAWRDSTSGGADTMVAISEDSSNYIYLHGANGNTDVGWRVVKTDGTARRQKTTGGKFTTGKWHYITLTKTGDSDVKVYINGVEDTSRENQANDSPPNVNSKTWIGRIFTVDVSLNYKGKLDNIRVYNYVRTQQQIAWEYNRGKPVGHWKLDECQGTTANDSSGNSSSGTITIGASGEDTLGTCTTSSTAWGSGATGKRNASLSFDGTDDYISLPSISTNFTSGFSVCAWTYFTNTATWARIIDFSESGSSNDNILFARNSTSSNLTYEVYVAGTSGGKVTATSAITNNTWAHFCASEDSSGNVVIYKNGVSVQTGTTGVPANVTRATSYIGKSNWSSDGYFGGQLDDIRIYNYPLTTTQVKDIMNEGAVRYGPAIGSP